MGAIAEIGRPVVPTRVLAGIVVPDTPIVSRAIEFARENSKPYLFNHSMRSWLFAEAVAQLRNSSYDAEVLAVSTLLHDLGLMPAFSGPLRFEVEGANAAREFARQQGMSEPRAQLIWDGVALNSTPSIGLYKEAEVSLCTAGIGLDWAGWGYETLAKLQIDEIVEAFPRLQMKQRFTDDVCAVIRERKATSYDNFARDFGERFVAGYTRPSAVDLIFDSPFEE